MKYLTPLISATDTYTLNAATQTLSNKTFGNLVRIDSYYSAITTDSDAATVTFDLSVANWHKLQLGGSRTLALSNVTVGQQFNLIIQQAASGGPYTPTWFAGITWIGSPYTAPSMPTTASAYLTVTFKCIASNTYLGWWLGNSAA